MSEIAVEREGLEKIYDTVERAHEFHKHRDIMNAHTHLAKDVRLSPLTNELSAALDRLKGWLSPPGPEEIIHIDGHGNVRAAPR